jgi:hypothetical protein
MYADSETSLFFSRRPFKGTMERLTLLRDFWTKVRSLGVFLAKFWVTDVKLMVEFEKKNIFVIRLSND